MNPPTHCIGIDIASATFTATISSSPGNVVATKVEIANSLDGYQEFLRWLTTQNINAQHVVICLEATGVYGESLCYFLAGHGYAVAVEPPLKVKRAFQQSCHKNDTVDSRQIAEYAHRFFDELTFWKPQNAIVDQIKVFLSAREQFTTQLTANVNTLTTLQRKHTQTPVANQMYQETIEQLRENIKSIDQEIRKLIDHDPSFRQMVGLLTSIPGVGILLASNLLVLTQGFTRIISAKQLAAHAGICPYEYSSGTSVFKRPRSRRHGPSTLRKLLYLAALSVRQHHHQFEHYFLRKVAEGKSKRLVINNIANKLLKVICAIVNSKQPYIPNYRSVNPRFLKSA